MDKLLKLARCASPWCSSFPSGKSQFCDARFSGSIPKELETHQNLTSHRKDEVNLRKICFENGLKNLRIDEDIKLTKEMGAKNTRKWPFPDADNSSTPPEIIEYQMGIHPNQQFSSRVRPPHDFNYDIRSRTHQYQANYWPDTSHVAFEGDQMTAQSRNIQYLPATLYNPQSYSHLPHNRQNPNELSSQRHTNSEQSYLNYFSRSNSSAQMPEQQRNDALLTPLYHDGKSFQETPTLVNSYFIPLKDYQQENKATNSDRHSNSIHSDPLLLSRYDQRQEYECYSDDYHRKNQSPRFCSPIRDLGVIRPKANDHSIDSSAAGYNINYEKHERMMKNRQIAKVFRARKKTKYKCLDRLIENEETNIDRVKSQLNNSLELAEIIDRGDSDSKNILEQLIYGNAKSNKVKCMAADSNDCLSHRMTHSRANSLPYSYDAFETPPDYLHKPYSEGNRSTEYIQSSSKNREFATGRYTRRSRDPQELSMMLDSPYSTPIIQAKRDNDYIKFTMGTYNKGDSKDCSGNSVQIFEDDYTGTKDDYDANQSWPEEKEYEFF